jgi:hypothetical protein
MVLGMQEPYRKGVATILSSESCAGVREDVGEALTGVRAGRVFNREIYELGGADALGRARKATRRGAVSQVLRATRGRRPRACTNAPCTEAGRRRDRLGNGGRGRAGKPKGAILR